MSASFKGTLARLMVLGVLGLTSCAESAAPRISPGQSADQVRMAAGAPSQERTLPGGDKAWYYISGPRGRTTYRVLLSPDGRVQESTQVLTPQNFRRQLIANKSTRDQVEDDFGRPALIMTFPNLQDEVWTYRWLDGTIAAKTDIHFDRSTGVARYYTMYWDPCPSGPAWCAGT